MTIDSMPVAVITGAARGIGLALVRTFHASGYRVIAVVRQKEDVDKISAIDPQHVLAINCDISQSDAESNLRDFLSMHTKKIDLLVNNAGVNASGYGINGLKFDELDLALAVHCYGAIRCIRACLSFLYLSSRPLIVNISSACASHELLASGRMAHNEVTLSYQLAQGALNMLTASLSAELRAKNIRILSFDPGPVKTRLGPADAQTTPEEVANAILELTTTNTDSGTFLHIHTGKIPW